MGRSKCAYLVVLFLLAATSVNAQLNPSIDSLLKYTSYRTRINIPAGDTGIWTWAVNTAIQQVCDKLPAYPKLDTIAFRQDSTGSALNDDFLRPRWVMKIDSSKKWFPQAEKEGDTLVYRVVSEGDATQDAQQKLDPNIYYFHGWDSGGPGTRAMKMFTHPKIAKDTFVVEFLVAYWARDIYIRPGLDTVAGDVISDTITDSTSIRPMYLDDVIELAAGIIKSTRE